MNQIYPTFRPTLSQFYSLEIRISSNYMHSKNVFRLILKLQNRKRLVGMTAVSCQVLWGLFINWLKLRSWSISWKDQLKVRSIDRKTEWEPVNPHWGSHVNFYKLTPWNWSWTVLWMKRIKKMAKVTAVSEPKIKPWLYLELELKNRVGQGGTFFFFHSDSCYFLQIYLCVAPSHISEHYVLQYASSQWTVNRSRGESCSLFFAHFFYSFSWDEPREKNYGKCINYVKQKNLRN